MSKYGVLTARLQKELLEQMGLEIVKIRPVVLRDETLDQLQDYRGFRHVAIHRYGFELKLDRVQALVEALPECYNNFLEDLQANCRVFAAIRAVIMNNVYD